MSEGREHEREFGRGMKSANPERRRRHWWIFFVLFVFAAGPFVPYVFMEAEHKLFGTVHCTTFFLNIGILEVLYDFYVWVGLWD
jgi:hypothetical protein